MRVALEGGQAKSSDSFRDARVIMMSGNVALSAATNVVLYRKQDWSVRLAAFD